MSITIDLSEDNAATLASQARAAQMPIEWYLAHIVECALQRSQRRAASQLEQHLDEMAAQIRPETTSEDMEVAIAEALAAVRPRRTWHS